MTLLVSIARAATQLQRQLAEDTARRNTPVRSLRTPTPQRTSSFPEPHIRRTEARTLVVAHRATVFLPLGSPHRAQHALIDSNILFAAQNPQRDLFGSRTATRTGLVATPTTRADTEPPREGANRVTSVLRLQTLCPSTQCHDHQQRGALLP
ncbi:hypothetical protein PC118_g4371 [Phytophthora cactorum]|uniref:Uncharacterized protein n=1 Tax=Phytophthora cactorum TaxID=29920 RepID=A0A8T1GIY2_9STRA|nr:hypothetical protein PC118_g4371 [Phytophthora cactorum]